ncbi:MAG: ferredoxin [Nanoarchaeota archaeon]
MAKIKVDKEKCIGCGSCESVCPEIFKMNEGKAEAKKAQVSKISESLKEAKDTCPMDAISID